MRLGVFGGTFDPVHFGHLRPIESAAVKFGLGRVLYVPARLSPLKTLAPTDSRHRIAMLALGLEGRPDWSICFSELDREPPSYTVDTLSELVRDHPDDELWLLMGTDVLSGFAHWRRPAEILQMARIAAFEREPFAGSAVSIPDVPGLRNRLEVFDAGSVKISSTELRDDLERGGRAEGRVPRSVAEYITKHGLYTPRVPQS
jgi:nicotinate-nucleotide adenylyltransferase